MGTLQFADLQTRPTEVLDLTSLTEDEFRQLVPPLEAVFQAYVAHWRLDGQPRIARRYTTYQNCPLPTPEDRLLFLIVYLKTYPPHVVQGRLFGMGQSKAHQCIRVLVGAAPRDGRGRSGGHGRADTEIATDGRSAGGCTSTSACLPPFGHGGTARRSERPQDQTEQTQCYSGKRKYHTEKNVLLINAALTPVSLRETTAASTDDERIADSTPSPLPFSILSHDNYASTKKYLCRPGMPFRLRPS